MARIKMVLFAVLALIMLGIAGMTVLRLRGIEVPSIEGGGTEVVDAAPPNEDVVNVNGTELRMRRDPKLMVDIIRSEPSPFPQTQTVVSQPVQREVLVQQQPQPIVTQVIQTAPQQVIQVTATPIVQQVVVVQPTPVPAQVVQQQNVWPTAIPNTNATIRGLSSDAIFYREYTIQAGDAMLSVASKNGSTVGLLRRYGISETDMYTGNIVLVPYPNPNYCNGRATYVVQQGDTLFSLARTYGLTVQSIRDANGIAGDLIRESEVLCFP